MKSFKVNPGDNFLRTDIENLISGKRESGIRKK